jgi:aryl-alcohol dehydrogenase-like predicted oxidoreductase
VAAVATNRGLPMAQIALAWLLHQPAVTAPIVGASEVSHVDHAGAALRLTLSPEETANLEELYEPHAIVGFQKHSFVEQE